jgi:hypothetical protein
LHVCDDDLATGDRLSSELKKYIPWSDPYCCCSSAGNDAADDRAFGTLLYADTEHYGRLRRRCRWLRLRNGCGGQLKRSGKAEKR